MDVWVVRAGGGVCCHRPGAEVLFHFCASQIDSWCKDNSYVIAGYYQANERVKDARYGLQALGGGFKATEQSLG